jgi:hypothetical protein
VSIVSRDTCIGPLIVDAPVMTNVSVAQTDKNQGSVMIKWTSPFEINRALFPPPYEYGVLRTKDNENFRAVTKTNLTDTVFVDSKLDITDSLYGYKVIVYSPNSIAGKNPIDTSAVAFYPRLTYQPLTNGVKLLWDASVPWSNQTPKFPWHYIYRKEKNASRFILMDSINVDTLTIPKGFVYYDFGSKANFALDANSVYVYKTETQGVYGNPKIHEPLLNFSNEVSAQPVDKSPPCAPLVTMQTISCETLINSLPCAISEYKNTISWAPPEGCGNDVAYYRVYFTESTSADTTLLATTSDTLYVHSRPDSFAGCYQVLAVDRSGNIGSLSPRSCVENCTYLFIPNVLTINGDGLNESFPNFLDQTGNREPSKCSRFVKEFSLQIFNRWGKEVFNLNGSPGTEWRGQDQNGNELSAGVYYYKATVFYYSLNENQQQNVSGSVNLMR